MVKDLFKFKEYRSIIKHLVDLNEKRWGLWGRLAKAINCQQTYLSQAMREKVHLTEEHLMGVAQFFQLSALETDFLMALALLNKAGTPALRRYYQVKVDGMKKDRLDLSNRIQQPRIEVPEREMLYYSSWMWSAIHILLTIPEFKNSPRAIAERLLIPLTQVEEALKTLEKLNIIEKTNQGYRLLIADLHVPKRSPMVQIHHQNWRGRALLDAANPFSEGLHFTGVYSMSRADYGKLKELLMDFIEQTSSIVGPSHEEELVALTCDLFSA